MALLCKMASPIIMKDLLRLFFFSLLFMEGASLECETCVAHSTTCSGNRKNCHYYHNACISWVTEQTTGNVVTITTMKACSIQSRCNLLKHGAEGWAGKSRIIIKHIQCSKAPASSGSFFLALSGFLLLKLLL